MFYVVELENNKFVVAHEMIRITTVEDMEQATTFNEKTLKRFLKRCLNDDTLNTDEGAFEVKTIHQFEKSNHLSLNDIFHIVGEEF